MKFSNEWSNPREEETIFIFLDMWFFKNKRHIFLQSHENIIYNKKNEKETLYPQSDNDMIVNYICHMPSIWLILLFAIKVTRFSLHDNLHINNDNKDKLSRKLDNEVSA